MTGNRNEDLRNIVLCLLMGFIGVLGLVSGESNVKTNVIDIILIVMAGGAGLWGIVEYRTTYIKKWVTQTERKNKHMQKKDNVIPEKWEKYNMYEIAAKYAMRLEKIRAVAIGMMTGFIMLIVSFELVGFENKVINILGYCIIPFVSGLTYYLVMFLQNGAVKKLKMCVMESGYDIQCINGDFMTGTKHQLFGGVLHIGMDYIIVCHKEESFIGKVCDINKVSKDTEIEKGSKYETIEIERFYIKIEMLKNTVRVMCMNEAEADAALKEFASRGILTVECEDLLFEEAKRDMGYRSRM